MVDFLRQYRKNVIAVIILALALIILFLVQVFTSKKDPSKAMQNQDYVYTFESNERKEKSSLPQINLKGESVKKQNAEIMELYYNVINGDKNRFAYQYKVEEGLLFLLIEIKFYDPANAGMETRYISYINDIKKGTLVSNEDVLDQFGYDENAIENSITKKMKAYYTEAVQKGLIAGEECDFSCYMDWRDMRDIKEGSALYFKNNKLVVYRGFSLESVYADHVLYDKKEPFLFELEE